MDDKSVPTNLPQTPASPPTPTLPQRPAPTGPLISPLRPTAPSFQAKPPAPATSVPPSAPLRVDSLSIPKIQSAPSPVPPPRPASFPPLPINLPPRPLTPPLPINPTDRGSSIPQPNQNLGGIGTLAPKPLPAPTSPSPISPMSAKPLSPLPPLPNAPLKPAVPLPAKPITPVPLAPSTSIKPMSPFPTSSGSSIPQPNQNLGGIGTALNNVSLKSSIRTMQDDLAAIKKGQMPVGIEFQKSKSELSQPVQPTSPKSPIPPTPVKPLIQVELGKTQTARPLNQPGVPLSPSVSRKFTTTPAPTLPSATPSGVAIPSANGLGRKNLYLLAIGVLIVLGVAGYFVYNNYFSTPAPTPIATSPTPTPTPILSELESILGPEIGTISIPPGENPYTSINSFKQNTNQGQLTFYKVNDGSSDLSFIGFLDRLLINHPIEFNNLSDKNGSFLAISGALPGVNVKTATGIFVVVKNIEETKIGMTKWESTIANDLKQLFGLDTSKKASPAFLDNSYQGVAIRYMNFPGADSTIDYAIVSLPSGSNLLVVTSSKALIYSLIDILVASQSR